MMVIKEMNIAQIYATIAGGVFGLLTILRFCFAVLALLRKLTAFALAHLVYPLVFRRIRFIGPYSRAGLLIRVIFISLNIFCSAFRVNSMTAASTRTANLALINLIPLFFGPHHSFIASILGISLDSFRQVHGSFAGISVIFGTIHTVLNVLQKPFSGQNSGQVYGLIAICTMALLSLSTVSWIKRPSYELFLRGHQVCAGISIYTIWRHCIQQSAFPTLCLYVLSGIFCTLTLLDTILCLCRNFSFNRGFSQAIVHAVGRCIRIDVSIPRPVEIHPGQYINIWLPRAGFRSLLQSHPFVVASWNTPDTGPMHLQLLVEPRDGMTRQLYRLCNNHMEKMTTYRHVVLYGGPYGGDPSLRQYGSVLLVASEQGIAALLPHLKDILDGYIQCQAVTRRAHLVWLLKDKGDEKAAQEFLNEALRQDSHENGYMLRVSIYYTEAESNQLTFDGEHARVAYHCGRPDLEGLVDAEMAGDYHRFVEGKIERRTGRETGDMIVAVSASNSIREELRSLVNARIGKGLRFMQTQFQPSSTYG